MNTKAVDKLKAIRAVIRSPATYSPLGNYAADGSRTFSQSDNCVRRTLMGAINYIRSWGTVNWYVLDSITELGLNEPLGTAYYTHAEALAILDRAIELAAVDA